MQMGQQRTKLHFFLTDIGEQKLILGYSWFAATQLFFFFSKFVFHSHVTMDKETVMFWDML